MGNDLSKLDENGNKLDLDDFSVRIRNSVPNHERYTSYIDGNDEVDEFVIFKDTLQCKHFFSHSYTLLDLKLTYYYYKHKALQNNEPQFYELITASLTPDQSKLIETFITTANIRIAEKESRKLKN